MMPVAFIAGPFRGPTAWDVAENVRVAERYGLFVARLGAMPLIPHANTHLFFGQLSEEDFWLPGYQRLLDLADCMVLIPGWERSAGTRAERDRIVTTRREDRIFDLSTLVLTSPVDHAEATRLQRFITDAHRV